MMALPATARKGLARDTAASVHNFKSKHMFDITRRRAAQDSEAELSDAMRPLSLTPCQSEQRTLQRSRSPARWPMHRRWPRSISARVEEHIAQEEALSTGSVTGARERLSRRRRMIRDSVGSAKSAERRGGFAAGCKKTSPRRRTRTRFGAASLPPLHPHPPPLFPQTAHAPHGCVTHDMDRTCRRGPGTVRTHTDNEWGHGDRGRLSGLLQQRRAEPFVCPSTQHSLSRAHSQCARGS